MMNQILFIDCKKDHKLRTPEYLGITGNLKAAELLYVHTCMYMHNGHYHRVLR